MLSFYFGHWNSFVWAVPKEGPIAFAQVRLSAKQFEKRSHLCARRSSPSIETIADIPAFDVAAAHEIYNLLLKPVEQGWRPAKSLIVVTNGALGMLPLGLLPTEPAKIEVNAEGEAVLRLLSQGCMVGAHARHRHSAVGRRAAHAARIPALTGQA